MAGYIKKMCPFEGLGRASTHTHKLEQKKAVTKNKSLGLYDTS